MSQLGDPPATPRTLLSKSGVPPKLKGGGNELKKKEKERGKKEKERGKKEKERGKKEKERGKKEKEENPWQQMSELSRLCIQHIPKKHIPQMKNEIAPTDKSALLPREKVTRRKEKEEKENVFKEVGEGEEGKSS